MMPTPRAPLPTAGRRPGSRPAGRAGAWLALLVVAWLVMQAFGQAHAVLHGRLPVVSKTAGAGPASAALLSRAFHPQRETDDPQADGGLCRLYGHAAQGDLAAGPPPEFVVPATFDRPAVATVASADTAPRHAPAARGPPAAG